jgi:hypothetical protein
MEGVGMVKASKVKVRNTVATITAKEDGVAPLTQHTTLAFSNRYWAHVGVLCEDGLRDLHPRQEGHDHMVLEVASPSTMEMFTFMMMNMSRFTPGTRNKEDPPPGFAGDLQPDQDVVAWYEACPRGLSRLLEQLPKAGEQHGEIGEEEEVGDHAFKDTLPTRRSAKVRSWDEVGAGRS